MRPDPMPIRDPATDPMYMTVRRHNLIVRMLNNKVARQSRELTRLEEAVKNHKAAKASYKSAAHNLAELVDKLQAELDRPWWSKIFRRRKWDQLS